MRQRKALYLLDCYICGTETFKNIRTKKPRCYDCAYGYFKSWRNNGKCVSTCIPESV